MSNCAEIALEKLMASRQLVAGNRLCRKRRVLSSGIEAMDAFLPWGGFECGAVSELIGDSGKHSLAIFSLAFHSRDGAVAYLSDGGVVNPYLLEVAGADLNNCFFLMEKVAGKLLWAAQQLIESGLFKVVVLYGSEHLSGRLLLDAVGYRRMMGLNRKKGGVLLILLDEHPSLSDLARPVSLRLHVQWRKKHFRLGDQNVGYLLRVLKCAGGSPGAVGVIDGGDLIPNCPPLHRTAQGGG